MKEPSIIGLMSDFGTGDGYVGAMKGRILSEVPHASIVDLTHDIPSFSIEDGAFALNNCYRQFPKGSVFVVVVDPGVGTERSAVILKTKDHWFVGPDNGVFSYVIHNERIYEAFDILIDKLPFEISSTFHGRDVFAPVGAWLSDHRKIDEFVRPHGTIISFLNEPHTESDTFIEGQVIHIDKFGNAILNITRNHLPEPTRSEIHTNLNNTELKGIRDTFGQVPVGSPLINFESTGFLQISVNQGHAAQHFGLSLRDKIRFKLTQ